MGKVYSAIGYLSVLLVATVLLWPAELDAQDQSFQIDARGGIAVPAGDTDGIWDTGFHGGLGITYWLNTHLGLRADGAADVLSGSDAGDLSGPFNAPDAQVFQYTGGFEFRTFDPADTPWTLNFNLRAGVASFTTDDFPADTDQPGSAPDPDFEIVDFSETYPVVSGGVNLGYQLHRSVRAFIGTHATYIPTEDNDFRPFANFDADEPVFFSPLWTVPVHAGVGFNL